MSSSTAVQFNIQIGNDLTWNVKPLLNEVKHALAPYIDNNRVALQPVPGVDFKVER